ncbi:MAG: tetratricopeptide repeat protein [Phycisphaeraceae bacterium]|nr:tetratricopeptide repeat protein [Phycisphaeraceae bacterium]
MPQLKSSRSKFATLLITLLLIGWVGACESHKTLNDQKNAAQSRWQQMRSSMILEEAVSQFETGDLESAESSVLGAINLDPDNPRLYIMMGRITMERAQLERANNYFRLAIEMDENMPDAHYFRGVIMQRWENYEEAYAAYHRAYLLLPDRPTYLLAATEMLIYLDREEEALETLLEKVVYFEGNAPIRVAIGQIYMLRGQPDKAAEYFESALVLQPEDLQIGEELALAQLAAGRFSLAIIGLERLLMLPGHENRTDLRYALASAISAQGREQDARRIYIELTRGEPREPEHWIRLSRSSWKLGDMSGALTAAQRFIELAPRRHEGHLMAGMVWLRNGDWDRAILALEVAAQTAPELAAPLIMRGMAFERTGRTAAARGSYREALQRSPGDSRALALLERLEHE